MIKMARSILAASMLLSSAAMAHSVEPIIIGGNPMFDACGMNGVIVGLDPQGDGFLSVRSGPGGKGFIEKDRVFNGEEVHICAHKGMWMAVVYTRSRALNCNVNGPWPVRQAYTGPCSWGWVHSRYVRITAG